MKDVLSHWNPFFESIIKSVQDEMAFLAEIETFCADEDAFKNAFHIFI